MTKHDPEWKEFSGIKSAAYQGAAFTGLPAAATGAFYCTSCIAPHVLISVYDCQSGIQVELAVTPAVAREIAADLLNRANKLEGATVR